MSARRQFALALGFTAWCLVVATGGALWRGDSYRFTGGLLVVAGVAGISAWLLGNL